MTHATTHDTRSASKAVQLMRTQAMSAAGLGRLDEARTLLETALTQPDAPKTELLGDIAAVALRGGDLVQAIAIARHVVASAPDHDAARFTLAASLAAIGSNAEALALYESLSSGAHAARFQQATPDLAALAATEAARLRSQVDLALRGGGVAAAHKYDFSHLTQPLNQNVPGGPIQDDEALLLYAVVRTMRVRRVLEIGGQSGYSARNFLQAMSWEGEGTVLYTVDVNPVTSLAPNHITICKDAAKLDESDVGNQPLDLVFFDCHVLNAQMDLFVRFVNRGLINDSTVIALHDTNLHPVKRADWAYPIRDTDGTCGYVHQDVERKMVNTLHKEFGYDAFCAHTDMRRSDERLHARHGVTLMKKFRELRT